MEQMFSGAAGQFESGALVQMFHEAVADATNEVFVLMPNLTANLPN